MENLKKTGVQDKKAANSKGEEKLTILKTPSHDQYFWLYIYIDSIYF